MDGGCTIDVILDNIDRLVNKEGWGGRLSIRINVDSENQDYFADTYNYLADKLAGGNVGIYAGYVDRDMPSNPGEFICKGR